MRRGLRSGFAALAQMPSPVLESAMRSILPNDEVSAIRAVAAQWTGAIESADVERLRKLMTEDIVVIHGNGRMLCGREAVVGDIENSLRALSVRQRAKSEETIVAGDWAFDRATVHTTISSRADGETMEFDSRTLTVLRKQNDRQWRVARVIGVVIQPR